jgi:hypothetical protein
MGLKYGVVEQLVSLAARPDFAPARLVTIGRLNVYLHPVEWRSLCASAGDARRDRLRAAERDTPFGGYADALLQALWPDVPVDVLDASDYEGANLLHDLNRPLPRVLAQRYDVVIEAGTLEHVFNVAEAFRTLLALARVGGVVIMDAPANNLCGHGFYQMSPELVYRVFQATNGYRLDACLLEEFRYPSTEFLPRVRAVRPRDPNDVRDRVRLMSRGPVELCAVATRTSAVEPFADGWPMQSDYQTIWDTAGHATVAQEPGVLRWLWRTILTTVPASTRQRLVGHRQVQHASLANHAHYVPLDASQGRLGASPNAHAPFPAVPALSTPLLDGGAADDARPSHAGEDRSLR